MAILAALLKVLLGVALSVASGAIPGPHGRVARFADPFPSSLSDVSISPDDSTD